MARQTTLIIGLADEAVKEEGCEETASLEQLIAAELGRDPSRACRIEPGSLPFVGHELISSTGAFAWRRAGGSSITRRRLM
jgi:hypothetical protein